MNLRADERSCDMCGARIPKGDKYVVSKVPREKARLYLEAMEANPELSATVTPDSQGNLRWDICLATFPLKIQKMPQTVPALRESSDDFRGALEVGDSEICFGLG